jgi:Ca-activated chloride channel family protein
MRRSVESIVIAVILVGCATGGQRAVAQSQTRVKVESSGGSRSADSWIGGAPVRTRVELGERGETYVGVWVEAPERAPAPRGREPMAVSLVIDTSGSMSGSKIAHARTAAQSLIENLDRGDRVSIYGFSNGVTRIAPPTVLSPETRGRLIERVALLQAQGGTNMHGGLSSALQGLSTIPRSHPIRRVMLISDGHANIGPADPRSLGDLAARGTEYGAQVTAIGVGLDYDENTLGALAVRSAGRVYHLRRPYQMARILERELHMLARTVATGVHIEVTPAPGVRILEGETLGTEMRDGKLRVPIGNLHAGQKREVLFRARIDTRRPGRHKLATARLVYEQAGKGKRSVQRTQLRYEVTRDSQAASESTQPRVQAMVASQRAAEAQMQAAQQLNRGQSGSAVRSLKKAEQRLRDAAQTASADQRQRLRRQADKVQQSRERAAGARSPSEARGAALETHDQAYELQGF